jgi:hypothetical protein
MTDVYSTTFMPDAGTVVELPEQIGRKDIGRYGGGAAGNGRLDVAVVGRGDVSEYVVLAAEEGRVEVPDGAEILGVDVADGTLYYAVPSEVYGE